MIRTDLGERYARKKVPVRIKFCASPEEFALAKKMVLDYAESLNTDLSFQNFDNELKHYGSVYGEPDGVMLIAITETGDCAGCVGLRRIDGGTCEMKRLFVYEAYRGNGIGRKLITEFMRQAQKRGYNRIRLDTFPSMTTALRFYGEFGFYHIEPYRYNPDPEAVFLECLVTPQQLGPTI